MSAAVPPLPHYAFMAWCSVKAEGQLLYDSSRSPSELASRKQSSHVMVFSILVVTICMRQPGRCRRD